MAGRRDGLLTRNSNGNSLRGSRIAVAITIGVLLGCVFAFLYPHGLFRSDPQIINPRLVKSNLQVRISVPYDCQWILFVCGLNRFQLYSYMMLLWKFYQMNVLTFFFPLVGIWVHLCCLFKLSSILLLGQGRKRKQLDFWIFDSLLFGTQETEHLYWTQPNATVWFGWVVFRHLGDNQGEV